MAGLASLGRQGKAVAAGYAAGRIDHDRLKPRGLLRKQQFQRAGLAQIGQTSLAPLALRNNPRRANGTGLIADRFGWGYVLTDGDARVLNSLVLDRVLSTSNRRSLEIEWCGWGRKRRVGNN